jgi:hypothetical protein
MSVTRVKDGKLQMRCLSLKQPYLHFIFDLPRPHRKDVENRTRSVTSEMGPSLFCASKSLERGYFNEACEGALRRGVPEALLPKFDTIETGVLYGCVRLWHLLPSVSLLDQSWKWKFPGHVGYVLKDALRLPPRPLRGAQTIFYVELTDEEQALLRAAKLL